MAWIKEWVDPDNDSVGNFWETQTILYNHRTQLSEMTIGVWKDAAAYNANKRPLFTKSYIIPSGLAPQLAQGAKAFVQAYAKAQPEFQGATDYVPDGE